jgi:hypothetical protein
MSNKAVLSGIVLTLISICGMAQNTRNEHSSHKRVMTEKFAMDTIMRLPEIKEDNLYIRRETKGKRQLFPLIYGDPDKEHPYYWVVVGEDNGMCFVTHFTFYVYTNGRKILYHYNFSDSTVDLNIWRRRMHKK